MTTAEKNREVRLRRMADRQGYLLRKPRQRGPRAIDNGEIWLNRYLVFDASGKAEAVANHEGTHDAWIGPFQDLDEVEAYLTAEGRGGELKTAEQDATGAKRQVTLYRKEVEVPADRVPGERLPVYRGDGPREGDLMGWATVKHDDSGDLALEFVPAEIRPPDEGGKRALR